MRIILNNINKSYDGRAVLSDFSLKSTAPEVISVMGASGSGKTTVLRIIAGLENGDSGEVITEGKIGYVFQEARLFPWLTALENVSCVCGDKKKAEEVLLLLGLENDLSKRPKELSGGMQQRVAFARAIAYDPDILLLDEAFGSQDYGKKEIMYDMIIARAETKIIINVTHNEQEACALGGRIVNMRPIV